MLDGIVNTVASASISLNGLIADKKIQVLRSALLCKMTSAAAGRARRQE
jgi:hypothetical protein